MGAWSLPGQRKEDWRRFRNPVADSNKKPTKAKMMQHSRGCLQLCSSSWLSEMATPCPTVPLGPIGWQIWRSLNKTSALAEAGLLQKRAAKTSSREERVHVFMWRSCFSFKITLHHVTRVLRLISSIRGLMGRAHKAWKLSLQTPSALSLCCQCEVTKENTICEIEQMILFGTWSTCMFSTWHAWSGVAWGAGGRNESLDDIKKEWNVILASDLLYTEHN